MRPATSSFRDDSTARVAAYESYLDLFTLLSFILIIAAFIYVTVERAEQNVPSEAAHADQMLQPSLGNLSPQQSTDQGFASVMAQVARSESGTPKTVAKDRLLLVIYREDSIDKLVVLGGTVATNRFDVTEQSIEPVLDQLSTTFTNASVIDVAVHKGAQDVNPGIFLSVSRWLPKHGYRNYNVFYSGN